MTTHYPWEEHYKEAILETDFAQLPIRIEVAQTAIHSRIEALEQDHDSAPEEREAIARALAGIRLLKEATRSS